MLDEALDRYTLTRDMYLQHRQAEVGGDAERDPRAGALEEGAAGDADTEGALASASLPPRDSSLPEPTAPPARQTAGSSAHETPQPQ
jgi:hypothetical protein